MSRKFYESDHEPDEPVKRSWLGWRRVLLLVVVMLLALLWFAPAIAVQSPFREMLLSKALQDVPGKISIGSISAGWLSPVVVNELKVVDAQGNELAQVETVKTGKNLMSLVLESSRIGEIQVDRPRLTLVIRPDGSNLEDFLQPLLAQPSSSSPRSCELVIVDGSVTGQHVGTISVVPVAWSLQHVNATVELPGNDVAPIVARVKSEVAVANQPPGQIAGEVKWVAATNAAGGGSTGGQAAVGFQASAFPLEFLNGWLQRYGSDVQMAGTLSVDMTAALEGTHPSAMINQFAAQNLLVASPSLLGPDQLKLSSLTAKGGLGRSEGLWQVRTLQLSSDMLSLEINGSAPARSESFSADEIVTALRAATGDVRAQVDLARLATLLPHTMRIREATQFSSGEISLIVNSQPQTAGHRWSAQLEAKNVAAVHEGRKIEWRQPIIAHGALRQQGSLLEIEQLTCDSSFLKLAGQGTLDAGELTASGDLTTFLQEVGQFIDVGQLKAAGNVQSNVQWKRTANELVSLQAQVDAENFDLAAASMKPWHEPKLQATFAGLAQIAGTEVKSWQQGQVEVRAAGDTLSAELREPMAGWSPSTPLPLRFKVQGSLDQWLTRLQMFVALPGWQLSGEELDFSGDATISTQRVVLADAKGSVKNLRAIGPSVFIVEPALQLQTTATYDVAAGELVATRTTVAATTFALRADQFRLWPQSQGGYALDGEIHYRTDLERLSSWFQDPRQPPSYRVAGAASGALRFGYNAGVTQADLTADVEQFAVATPPTSSNGQPVTAVGQTGTWPPLWQEPRLQLAMVAAYDGPGDRVTVSKLQAAGESLSVGAAGAIDHPLATADVDLSGQYAYDLQRLSDRLRGLLGPQVTAAGTGTQPFSVRGPLLAAFSSANRSPSSSGSTSGSSAPAMDLRSLAAQLGLSWDKLNVRGMQIGAAELNSKLENGQLTIAPVELPVSDGIVRLNPRVDLTRTPYMVTIPPGMVVEQVRISPEMCHTWLKYIAPLVAEATAAEGRFSIQVDDATFPADDPTGGKVGGRFVVHSAQIGPGPLAQELFTVGQQIRALLERRPPGTESTTTIPRLEIPEQQLQVQLADHRVYHRDMQMVIKDMVVKTQGWVGLDQQISLLAEIPIRDEWVSRDRYLASLKGQSVKLPIAGTLTRPQIDRRAITDITRQTLQNAGQNFLQDQLNRGLDRLFQPGQPGGVPPATPQQ